MITARSEYGFTVLRPEILAVMEEAKELIQQATGIHQSVLGAAAKQDNCRNCGAPLAVYRSVCKYCGTSPA